jgi:hypothetical protein
VDKSSLVEKFSKDPGLECESLLGSRLAPEDLVGISRIDGNVSRFYRPAMIVREREFVLFIDELNIASQEIQKASYSLILGRRIGEYCRERTICWSGRGIYPRGSLCWSSRTGCARMPGGPT